MDNFNSSPNQPEPESTTIAEALPENPACAPEPVIPVDLYGPAITSQPAPRVQSEVPTLANTFLFFALAIAVTLILGVVAVGAAQLLPAFRHQDFKTLALDARLTIPSQAIEYLALLGTTVLLFRSIWQRPFWQAIHWNTSVVAKRWIPLVGTGLVLGLINGAASNLLPMPKEAPILNDLMRSTTGAWLMFLFGTTMAPLMEELAFRGFLLPSLINFFRWLTRRKQLPEDSGVPHPPNPPSPFIIPVSILLASIPFALLHSEQVSGAWAPVLLIGIVSVVLCIVRLWTRSLAASAFVHATYNFTLFAGMMIASDGFRHLDKLNN
jgi:membrane protease YdiL (CAAX protease family)